MNQIICSDVLTGLATIPTESIHLIVTSPPYNARIDYDNYSDDLEHKEYLSWMNLVWKECYRVLVNGGRICINVDATTNPAPQGNDELVHPLHVEFTNQLRNHGYIYRGEIIWCKQNAPGSPTAWGSYCSCSNPRFKRNTEYVIFASKGSSKLEGDPRLCDLTKDEFHKWTLTEWQITPETNDKGHPVPFPRELVTRCIKLFSYVGNVVLDPFNGSGTTTSMAYYYGRQYIGIDNSVKYCKKAERDIAHFKTERGLFPYKFTPSPDVIKNKEANKKKPLIAGL